MSETEHLRAMLDERGVKWSNIRNDGSESDYLTEWQFDGIEGHAIATEWAVGNLTVCIAHPMSPEQAIAATLGPCSDSCNCTNDCTNGERTETCEMEYVTDWMSWHCKSCDHMDMAPRNPKPRYCKWCGRKVVDDD